MHIPRPLSQLIGLVAMCLTGAAGHTASGFLGSLMNEVGGDAVQVIKSMAPQAAATGATEKLCGSAGDAWCRNLTASVVSDFSTEFVDRMTREDLQKASEARQRAIRTGEPQVWENPESGARGTVVTTPAAAKPPEPVPVTVEQNVELTAPILDAVGEPFVVRAATATVLNGPGPGYNPVMELAQGARINAIARVQQTNWYLVGEGPIGKGYLDGALIEPAPITAPPAAAQPAAPAVSSAPAVAATPEPAKASAPARAAAKPAQPAGTRQVEVKMAAECYTTRQKVSLADGTSEEATVTSCRTPDGWVQV